MTAQTWNFDFTQIDRRQVALSFLLDSLGVFRKEKNEFAVSVGKLSVFIVLIDGTEFFDLSESPLAEFISECFSDEMSVFVFFEFFDVVCVSSDVPCRSCDLMRIECNTSNSISCTRQSWLSC